MRYGLAKKFHAGIRLKIYPTFKCNLDCSYCGNDLGVDLDPRDTRKKLDVQDWFSIINTFPVKVKEVVFTGGEPTLWNGFSELANKLLDHGYFVMVLTNLTAPEKLNKVKRSNKFLILSTFHGRHYSTDMYETNYYLLKRKHRIIVKEIAEKRLSFSKMVPWGCTVDLGKESVKNCLYIGPDGTIFKNCYEVMNHYKYEKN